MQNSVKSNPILFVVLSFIAVSIGIGTAIAATDNTPSLTIPSEILSEPNSVVEIPVSFAGDGNLIANLAFSIDYDETWLDYDPLEPDSISFNLPADNFGSCVVDKTDTDGEIDCTVVDPLAPLNPIPDGTFLTIKLQTLNPSGVTIADVDFSQDPPASFGNTDGQSVAGVAVNGSVKIGHNLSSGKVYLPILKKDPTLTPTPTPTITPTPTATLPPEITPTDTPTTEPPGCTNLIDNGGFEEDGVAWVLPVTNYPAKYTSSVSFTGDQSMRTGINLGDNTYSYSSAWQLVTIPSDATSADLTFYFNPQTTEPLAFRLVSSIANLTIHPFENPQSDPPFDQQMALILNEDGTHDWTLMSTLSNTRSWTASNTYDLMSYKGKSIWVAFTTYNDGGGGKTAMYIDDVVLEVCE